jgi:hypothetical protein
LCNRFVQRLPVFIQLGKSQRSCSEENRVSRCA